MIIFLIFAVTIFLYMIYLVYLDEKRKAKELMELYDFYGEKDKEWLKKALHCEQKERDRKIMEQMIRYHAQEEFRKKQYEYQEWYEKEKF